MAIKYPLFLAVSVALTLSAADRASAYDPPPDPRQVVELNQGWRFQFKAPASASKPGFDDNAWEKVDLPHTFNALDGADGGGYRRGPGWYRLRFTAPGTAPGRRFYLRFGGAGTVSTVWLNGKKLGVHHSGASAFCYDATQALKPGGENVLAVCADNTWRDDVPPLEGDFTQFGGLYRGVTLIVANEVSVDLLDFGGPGIYIDTYRDEANRWRMRARVVVRNQGRKDRNITVILMLLDDNAKSLAGRTGTEWKAKKGTTQAVLEILPEGEPGLWHGRENPYLYQALFEVWADGQLLDRVTQTMGFRSFSFDPEKGFLLNGKPYDLRGANMHQDREGKGWALSPVDREEDLDLLTEMGGTFVRLAHYQHDGNMMDLCDKLGIVVWAEHGLVNVISPKKAFAENAVTQLTELIRQNYNHPSIAVWGIGNEVQTHKPPQAKKLMARLARRVKAEDPHRPSVLASNLSEVPGTFEVDLVGHNQYFGWYYGTFADLPKWLDAQRAKAPDKCQGLSEYGAGAGIHTHSAAPKAQDHSEEWQNLYHEAYWQELKKRPWVWCKAVWNMFDFASDGRNEGEKPGINDKGLVTRDRKVKKDAYFWYKANWNPNPMVYITSRRFTLRDFPKVAVKVYSNCDKVTLTLNGKVVGTQRVKDCKAVWDVVLAPGSNKLGVSGVAKAGGAKDSCSWFYEPRQ